MDPRPIDEAEEKANKKTFGDDYVRRVPTHFRGYTIDDNGQKTLVVRLEVATPRNSFTPFFFCIMNLILKTLGLMDTVEAILDGLKTECFIAETAKGCDMDTLFNEEAASPPGKHCALPINRMGSSPRAVSR